MEPRRRDQTGESVTALLVLLMAAWPAPQSPAVPQASGYVHIEGAPFTPTNHEVYKAVFEATQGAGKPTELVPALDMLGSELNALAVENVPLPHAQFAVVFHGRAMDGILDDAHYQQKFGTKNPNLPVLAALKKQGTQLYVCGQNLVAEGIDPKSLTPDVVVASDALLVLIALQQKGYAVLSF
jgi:intracellular sulfur oxidation DsrE/DsrF family protein